MHNPKEMPDRGGRHGRERERLMKGVRNVTKMSPYEMKHAI